MLMRGEFFAAGGGARFADDRTSGTPPSTSGGSGVNGQVRVAVLPGAAGHSDEYRRNRAVVGKRDQLPSVDRYGAAVPRCPGHVSFS